MEDLFPKLENSLRNAVEIKENKNSLLIELKVKEKDLIPGDLGSPNEVEEMIRIFGGVKDEIQMKVDVDKTTNTFSLKFENEEDYEAVSTVMKNIWQRASELLIKAYSAEPGNIGVFRELGDFDEKY